MFTPVRRDEFTRDFIPVRRDEFTPVRKLRNEFISRDEFIPMRRDEFTSVTRDEFTL